MISVDRRTLFVIAASVAVFPGVVPAKSHAPRILFVCDYATAKSAIARELFRKRARARGVDATAFSRGLHVEDHVSPPLRQKLDAEGIDTRRDGFDVLTVRDIRAADIVVSFTTLPSSYHPRVARDWSDLPSVNDAWPVARADLDRRIEALLDQLSARTGAKR